MFYQVIQICKEHLESVLITRTSKEKYPGECECLMVRGRDEKLQIIHRGHEAIYTHIRSAHRHTRHTGTETVRGEFRLGRKRPDCQYRRDNGHGPERTEMRTHQGEDATARLLFRCRVAWRCEDRAEGERDLGICTGRCEENDHLPSGVRCAA